MDVSINKRGAGGKVTPGHRFGTAGCRFKRRRVLFRQVCWDAISVTAIMRGDKAIAATDPLVPPIPMVAIPGPDDVTNSTHTSAEVATIATLHGGDMQVRESDQPRCSLSSRFACSS